MEMGVLLSAGESSVGLYSLFFYSPELSNKDNKDRAQFNIILMILSDWMK